MRKQWSLIYIEHFYGYLKPFLVNSRDENIKACQQVPQALQRPMIDVSTHLFGVLPVVRVVPERLVIRGFGARLLRRL